MASITAPRLPIIQGIIVPRSNLLLFLIVATRTSKGNK